VFSYLHDRGDGVDETAAMLRIANWGFGHASAAPAPLAGGAFRIPHAKRAGASLLSAKKTRRGGFLVTGGEGGIHTVAANPHEY
jgi:hypothetical protein